jgi:DNA repair protein RecN (Recombination protein N)
LQDEGFQMEVLDGYAGLEDELWDYRRDYNGWMGQIRELGRLKKEEEKARSEQDFYQFQFDELEAAKLRNGEQEEIEQELEVLNHAGEIKARLNNSVRLLADEQGLLEQLAELKNELKSIHYFKREFNDFYERIESNYLDIQDIARDIEREEENVEMDPERAETLNGRLNFIYQLQQKHRCDSVEKLIELKLEYENKLTEYSSIEGKITSLEKELEAYKKKIAQKAKIISEKRRQAKKSLEKEVLDVISGLGLSKARFVVDVETSDELKQNGVDSVLFRFSANPGGVPQEISKVASGGELSRLMLAIKSIIAGKKLLSTIIFDEIDSGVSGEIAGKMGGIMQEMSKDIQIIAITHLPQIAARGSRHYLVYKEQNEDSASTFLKLLTDDDRIIEIAKMLSDAKVSLSAVETARELLKN